MNILLWVVFGGLAGWLASVLMGTDGQMGLLANVLVGVAGAFIGGWLSDWIGASNNPGADRPTSFLSFVFAVVGAAIVLYLLNLIFF